MRYAIFLVIHGAAKDVPIPLYKPVLVHADIEDFLSPPKYDKSGLLKNDNSTQLHLSPVAKGEIPLLYISYNEDGFISHCRKYKEYQEWVKKRNPVRYASNLNKNYDSKNIMHCFRLIHMCKEILLGQGFNVKRTEDREFLMDIRNHKFEYDNLIAQLDTEVKEIEDAYKISTLPEKPDSEWLDKYLAKTIKTYITN